MNHYSTGRVCTLCGALTQEDAIVCPHCGTALPPPKPTVAPPPVQPPASSLNESVPANPMNRLPVPPGHISIIDPSKHNPTIAVLTSAVIPGLGQIYNRQVWKGVLIMAVVIGPTFFIPVGSTLSTSLDLTAMTNILIRIAPLLIVIASLSSICLYDALRIAQRLKKGDSIGPWQWF